MSDAAARLLAVVVRLLPPDRAHWGRAMTGELEEVQGAFGRWAFVVGCARATLLLPQSRSGAARLMVPLVITGAAACTALVGYGFVRYPGLRTGIGTWLAVTTFLAVLAGYTAMTVLVARWMPAQHARSIARRALAGGVLVAGLWFLVGLYRAGSGLHCFWPRRSERWPSVPRRPGVAGRRRLDGRPPCSRASWPG
jgi:hypothetical protein